MRYLQYYHVLYCEVQYKRCAFCAVQYHSRAAAASAWQYGAITEVGRSALQHLLCCTIGHRADSPRVRCRRPYCTVLNQTRFRRMYIILCSTVHYTVQYCTVINCTVLRYTVLCCTALYCAVCTYSTVLCCVYLLYLLYGTVLYCTVPVLCCAIHTVLYSTATHNTVLYCTVQYSTELYCTVLCCIYTVLCCRHARTLSLYSDIPCPSQVLYNTVQACVDTSGHRATQIRPASPGQVTCRSDLRGPMSLPTCLRRTVLCSTVPDSNMESRNTTTTTKFECVYSTYTIQHSAILYCAIMRVAVLCSTACTVQHSAAQHRLVVHSTALYCTVQRFSVLCCAVQHGTPQHSAAQWSTVNVL